MLHFALPTTKIQIEEKMGRYGALVALAYRTVPSPTGAEGCAVNVILT